MPQNGRNTCKHLLNRSRSRPGQTVDYLATQKWHLPYGQDIWGIYKNRSLGESLYCHWWAASRKPHELHMWIMWIPWRSLKFQVWLWPTLSPHFLYGWIFLWVNRRYSLNYYSIASYQKLKPFSQQYGRRVYWLGIDRTWSNQALDIKRLPQFTGWHLPSFYSPILIFSLNGVRGRRNGVNVSPLFSDI